MMTIDNTPNTSTNSQASAATTPVRGYTPLTQDQVDDVNSNKAIEERLLRRVETLLSRALNPIVDPRWAAVAKTHFEQGFMALNRAIMQPKRITLSYDDPAEPYLPPLPAAMRQKDPHIQPPVPQPMPVEDGPLSDGGDGGLDNGNFKDSPAGAPEQG